MVQHTRGDEGSHRPSCSESPDCAGIAARAKHVSKRRHGLVVLMGCVMVGLGVPVCEGAPNVKCFEVCGWFGLAVAATQAPRKQRSA